MIITLSVGKAFERLTLSSRSLGILFCQLGSLAASKSMTVL